ncbi:hypothetical protein AVEN_165826-1 [Araneus ventricosus]|uniref:Ionotropic glutamate receptor L-glutamate and glycine-binding domain-containing protein n=1 Tax=Araneus ventricosus TaxID=182803 RepID=A0A4Y2EPH2_ARAVE|nr:hypothetical protein AVEN_165826-1 [Araneus ventricosus]
MPGEGKPTSCGIVHWISFSSARAVVKCSKIEGKGPCPVTSISSSLFLPTGLFENPGTISCALRPVSPLFQLSCQMIKASDLISVLSANISENGAVKFGEFEEKLLQVVLDVLGTDYNTVVPKDMSFDSLLPNGSWKGVIGMIQKGEADLAFIYPSVIEEKMKAASFSTDYAIDACIFITVIPETIKSAFSFLHPFVITTQIAVFLSVSLMAILFAKFRKRKYAVFETFFKLFGNFSQQPSMLEDRSLKYKVLLMTWLLFATVISLRYSATLLSFLIRPIKDTMIRTFSELTKAVPRGTRKAIFFNYKLSVSSKFRRRLSDSSW